MSRNLITILETMPQNEVPVTLVPAIEKCILARKMAQSAGRRCVGFTVASVISLVLFIPILKSFLALYSQSGAGEFISLLFSDTATLYWKEIVASIFESLPIVSITAVVATAFVLVLSLGFMIKDLMYLRNVRTLNV